MMSQTDFVLLLNSLMVADVAVLKSTQERFKIMSDENPLYVLQTCSNIFKDNTHNDSIRILAGLILKNTIYDPKKNEFTWNHIDQKIRKEIKDDIYGVLTQFNQRLRPIAARNIAKIYVTELPLNEPNETIQLFTQEYQQINPEVRKYAIQVLSEIIEEFTVRKIKPTIETASQLLKGIQGCLRDNERPDIIILGVEGLTSFLSLGGELFNKTAAHEEIVMSIMQVEEIEDEDLKSTIMEFLREFVRLHYPLAKNFASEIWKMSSSYITSESKGLSGSAMEVWNVIGEQENRKAPNEAIMIPQVEKFLLSLLIQNLTDETNYDDYEWNPDKGDYEMIAITKQCLTLIAKHPGTRFKEYTSHLLENLENENALEVGAGLFIYSCHLDSSQEAYSLIEDNIYKIIELAKNPDEKVQKEAAAVLAKIAEVTPQIYFQGSLSSNLLALVTRLIESNPRVSINIVRAWQYLVEYIVKYNIEYDLRGLTESFLKNLFSKSHKNFALFIRQIACTLEAIFKGISENDVKIEYIKRLIQELTNTWDNLKEYDEIDATVTGVMCCLRCLVYKMQFSESDQSLQMSILEEIFIVIDASMSKNENHNISALNLLSAIPSVAGPLFNSISDRIWSYIKTGSEALDRPELLAPTLRVLEEIACSGSDKSSNHLPKILQFFDDIYSKDAVLEENVLPAVLISLGKIALGYRENILPYVKAFYKIYDFAIKHDYQAQSKELAKSVLESYFSFSKSLSSISKDQTYLELVLRVINLIKETYKDQDSLDKNELENAIVFLRDIAELCKGIDVEQDAVGLIEGLKELLKNYRVDDSESIMTDSEQIS